MSNLPDQKTLQRLLDYNPETGKFRWKMRGDSVFDVRYAGAETFTNKRNGYLRGRLTGSEYVYAHRVAYKYIYGTEPVNVDHINGNRSDNRIANLRGVLPAENRRNAARYKNNSSGTTGVGFDPRFGKWRAYIRFEGHLYFLGHHLTRENAVAARQAGERRFGFHTNHGRVPR